MKKINIGTLLLCVAIPLLVGILSALISMNGMKEYANLVKPPLSPPPYVFSIAWTILYIMMGISCYIIVRSDATIDLKVIALFFYVLQLILNFLWPIMFFVFRYYMFSFIWLIGLLIVVIVCEIRFYSISSAAGLILLPYILWLLFASYLNICTAILNPI